MSARNKRGRAASQRISKTSDTIEGNVATGPNTANAKTTVKPRFLKDENAVTATRSDHGTSRARMRTNTRPPKRKVLPNDRRARETKDRRVSPLRIEVIGTTAIAGGTAAMRTQPFRIWGSGLRTANERMRPLRTT